VFNNKNGEIQDHFRINLNYCTPCSFTLLFFECASKQLLIFDEGLNKI
jgi:hypothetical protein